MRLKTLSLAAVGLLSLFLLAAPAPACPVAVASVAPVAVQTCEQQSAALALPATVSYAAAYSAPSLGFVAIRGVNYFHNGVGFVALNAVQTNVLITRGFRARVFSAFPFGAVVVGGGFRTRVVDVGLGRFGVPRNRVAVVRGNRRNLVGAGRFGVPRHARVARARVVRGRR